MVVKEGLFLYEHGVPPYNGGVCHQVRITPPNNSITLWVKGIKGINRDAQRLEYIL
jgi:hypothetical protein